MWIYLNNAFLSIVEHKDAPQVLLVRARCEGDIQRVFPEAMTWTDSAADYRHRAYVSRNRVSEALAAAVHKIDYTNLKGSISGMDNKRYIAYMACWRAMMRWQRQLFQEEWDEAPDDQERTTLVDQL